MYSNEWMFPLLKPSDQLFHSPASFNVISIAGIHRRMEPVSFYRGAEDSCPNILSIACPKIKGFCPHITWFILAWKWLFEKFQGSCSPCPPPPPPPRTPMLASTLQTLVCIQFEYIIKVPYLIDILGINLHLTFFWGGGEGEYKSPIACGFSLIVLILFLQWHFLNGLAISVCFYVSDKQILALFAYISYHAAEPWEKIVVFNIGLSCIWNS